MKTTKRKTTEAFKEMMIHREIIPKINFIGMRMYFPYLWNGNRVHAVIRLEDIIKSIKWDVLDVK